MKKSIYRRPRRFHRLAARLEARIHRRDYYINERCQTSSGWNRRPWNRLCATCRLTFPGNVPEHGVGKHTLVCPECGGELVQVSATLRVPRRTQVRAWAKLAKALTP